MEKVLYKLGDPWCLSGENPLKTAIQLVVLMAFGLGLIPASKGQEQMSLWTSIKNPATVTQLKSFVAAKEAQANAATNKMPAEFKTFFVAADKGDWLAVSNIFENLQDSDWSSPKNPDCHGTLWETTREIWGAFDAFCRGEGKYSGLFGNEIIPSIPPGSIYFGGTEPGRFIVTAMQKSQIKADPFFTLTQNAMADGMYFDYLRNMYGKEIYIPTANDSQRCFDEFYADIIKRYKHNQLKVGEEVTTSSNGLLQVSGRIDVMEINALIVKVIFDHETNRDFYVEESVPLDWMYPYLEPHGLIFKLNHHQLAQIPDSVIQQDHDYWAKMISPMIGGWLHDDTPLNEVAAFADRVFAQHDFKGFQGDPIFEKNEYTQLMFSKERVSIAGLYAWRAEHSDDTTEKKRMQREADFAFRQAWAMDPASSEASIRYIQFLVDTSRTDDAILIARTCLAMAPHNATVLSLLNNLEQYKRQRDDWVSNQNRAGVMEKESHLHPSNYTNIFSLAACYLQIQQTNRATELMLQTASRPNVPVDVLRGIASFFAQMDDYPSLEITLKKLAAASPGAPEPRYDLARLDVLLGKKNDAINNLQTAIVLSDQRLKTNSTALNIRKAASSEREFDSFRKDPAFQKLMVPDR